MSPTVIDIGCARQDRTHYSLERIIDRFHPSAIYGFDPDFTAASLPADTNGTRIVARRQAVWTRPGTVGFRYDREHGRIDPRSRRRVRCVDIADVVECMPADRPLILKIDAEGAEYELLERLIALRLDRRLQLVWLEWHPWLGDPDGRRRRRILERIRCPVEEVAW